jgi:hypothetical protein
MLLGEVLAMANNGKQQCLRGTLILQRCRPATHERGYVLLACSDQTTERAMPCALMWVPVLE